MNQRQKARALSYAVIGAFVLMILAGVQYCRSRGQDKAADRHVTTSIAVDKVAATQEVRSLKLDHVVVVAEAEENRHKAKAADLKKVADTVGQHALTLRDTSEMWHLRWNLRGLVITEDSLALAAADLKADSLKVDRDAWRSVARLAVASQDSLRTDLALARSGCRILPLVPCLSRKQTMIVGIAAGAIAVVAIERARDQKQKPAPQVKIAAAIHF